MTLFEYLAIALSLVFSFTALRLVGGLTHTLNPTSRFWVHATLNIGALLLVVIVFWVFWSFRDVQWTFPKFVLALSAPGALYYVANTLIPDDPSTVGSWREYYFSVRVKLFVALGLWAVLTVLLSTLLLDMPLAHPARIGQVTMLIIAVIGVVSPNARIHAVLAITMLVAIFVFGMSIFLNPSPLNLVSKIFVTV